jgi:hypothetical protein
MQATIEALHAKGERHDGDSIKVLKTSTLIFAEQQKAVQADVLQRSVNIVDKSGRTVTTTEAAKGAFAATLGYQAGRWVLLQLQVVAS